MKSFFNLAYVCVALTLGVAIMSVSAPATAQEDEIVDPYVMIQEAAQVTFDRIKAEQELINENPDHLRTIMRENLIPYVDYRFSAFMVLGKHAKSTPRPQLMEFVSVFREYLVTTYANAMGYYDDQEVLFQPASDFKGKKTITVRALIKDDGRPDIDIAFKVRYDSRTNSWKGYDMVAEGISLLSSKRSEFEGIIRSDGVDKVIELMKDQSAAPIVLQNATAKN